MEKMLMPGKASATEGMAAGAAAAAVPGKQTLAQQLPVVELAPEHVARFKTKRVKDGGGYVYEVTDEGAFAVVEAPGGSKVAHGTLITRVKYPAAWQLLATILLSTSPQASTPAPEAATPPAPAKVDELVHEERAPTEATPTAEDEGDKSPAIDTSAGDLFWIATPNCKVRKETGAAVTPEQLIPQFSHVRVLDKKVLRDFTNAKVAKLDGTPIGWASFQHMTPLRRPARPSTAAAQMAAVLAAARSNVGGATPTGHCFHWVKAHILGGGGYGDILDIQQDERFVGHTVPAVDFHKVVQKYGEAAMGLESVSGLPMGVSPGTILVLRPTPKNKLDPAYGDISVVDKVVGNWLHCFNDGLMQLPAQEPAWSGEGKFADSVLGMYKPIDRS